MNPSYNLYNDRQLIERQQTYVLERKLVTIHSEDRDILKFPSSSEFEIEMPQDYLNVYSAKLSTVSGLYECSNSLSASEISNVC